MKRLIVIAAALLALPLASALADPQSCREFRDNIVRMESESVRPPGWFALDQHLRRLYQQQCIHQPTRRAPLEYWYRWDGSSTGVPAFDPIVYEPLEVQRQKYPNGMPARPADAAYATTPEINERCVKRGWREPAVCVMGEMQREACLNPVDTQPRNHCKTILGSDEKASMPPAGEELPPLRVGLDGGPYTLTNNCDALLGRLSGDPLLEGADPAERARWLGIMRSECPDFLDALKRRTGIDPVRDAGRFWPAVGDLAFNGFAPPGTPSRSPASLANDPNWQRMCQQAEAHRSTCLQRMKNMQSMPDANQFASGTYGAGEPGAPLIPDPVVRSHPDDVRRTSQSGAFFECAALYGQVVNMCHSNRSMAERLAARMPPPAPPKPAAPPPQAKSSGGDSRPPPKPQPQQPQMSAKCQKLISTYVTAAQANDGPAAMAGYNALKKEGGCGLLDKVDRTAAAPAPGAYPSRRATPNIDGAIGTCDRAVDGCAEAMRQLEAATSPAAKAALIANAIRVGLELGVAMANMAAIAAQSGGGGGGGTNYNSIGNRPAARTYGQGSPGSGGGYQPPPVAPCGPGPVCTAR
jgi:hypothetical protein